MLCSVPQGSSKTGKTKLAFTEGTVVAGLHRLRAGDRGVPCLTHPKDAIENAYPLLIIMLTLLTRVIHIFYVKCFVNI